jgi:hypothetical protein
MAPAACHKVIRAIDKLIWPLEVFRRSRKIFGIGMI